MVIMLRMRYCIIYIIYYIVDSGNLVSTAISNLEIMPLVLQASMQVDLAIFTQFTKF